MGLEVVGVDILHSNTGPKVLEVNSWQDIESIEKATKIDIASLIIEHVEKEFKLHKKKKS